MDSKEERSSGRLAARGIIKRPVDVVMKPLVDVVSTKRKSSDTGSSHSKNKKDSKIQGGESNPGPYVGATVNATQHLAVFQYQPKYSANDSDVGYDHHKKVGWCTYL